MKSIKRAAPWGAIRNILIILFLITIVVLMATYSDNTTTAKKSKVSSPIKTEQVKKDKPIEEVEEKSIKEEIEIPQVKTINTVSQAIEQPVEEVISQPIEAPTTYTYNITPEDRETLARLIYLEGNVESIECQKAIASVVINRLNSGYWGNTINNVIYARGQFTPASRIPYTTPTATNYEAVDYVLTNGVTLPSYCLYFRAGYHFSWNGYVPYTAIGNTYFGYMSKDKK